MNSPATRTYVRHAGDFSAEELAERDRIEAEHQAELAARQAALAESNPELAAWVAKKVRFR